jgi:hypothetical protein
VFAKLGSSPLFKETLFVYLNRVFLCAINAGVVQGIGAREIGFDSIICYEIQPKLKYKLRSQVVFLKKRIFSTIHID